MTKLAIVFPGQGSQSIGMIADIYKAFPEVKDYFDRASNIIGYDLWDLISNGPKEKLDSTEYAQVALLVASYSVWQVINRKLLNRPDYFAGHSLGEYTALLCSKSISFNDAVVLVALRGELMQQAVARNTGAMAAILGLEDSKVIVVCNELVNNGLIVSAANFNAPGQVVISGRSNAVKQACKILKKQGAKRVVFLPVRVASHCALMHGVAIKLADHLETITVNIPETPVLHNVDASCRNSAIYIKDALIKQLCSSVRWVETINVLSTAKVSTVIECGPGSVLTGLNRRINRDLNLRSINSMATIEEQIACNSE